MTLFAHIKKAFLLIYQGDNAKKRSGPQGATNTHTALEHNRPIKEAEPMSRCGYNCDSDAKDNPEQTGTFTPIGVLARRLAEKAGGAK